MLRSRSSILLSLTFCWVWFSTLLTIINHYFANMSEKLCLQWNDFKDNVNSTFRRLRVDKEFTDLTLVCEDGQQIEAHKVILTSSSPFFEKILQTTKHHHPLIYLKGFQSKDFVSILDFLYFGEANIFQEDFDSFLALLRRFSWRVLLGKPWVTWWKNKKTPNFLSQFTRTVIC